MQCLQKTHVAGFQHLVFGVGGVELRAATKPHQQVVVYITHQPKDLKEGPIHVAVFLKAHGSCGNLYYDRYAVVLARLTKRARAEIQWHAGSWLGGAPLRHYLVLFRRQQLEARRDRVVAATRPNCELWNAQLDPHLPELAVKSLVGRLIGKQVVGAHFLAHSGEAQCQVVGVVNQEAPSRVRQVPQ